MTLRKTTASGMVLMSTGGTIRLPRVKLPPAPGAEPAPAPHPAPAAPQPVQQQERHRVVIIGRAQCPQALEAMKELVDAGETFTYCDVDREPELVEQVARLMGPLELPVLLTIRMAPGGGCAG